MRNLVILLLPAFIVSIAHSQEVKVKMQNGLNDAVEVFWVNPDSGEIRYASIPAGQGYDQQTYPGHKWRFKAGGQVVGEYVATNAAVQQYQVKLAQKASPLSMFSKVLKNQPGETGKPKQPQVPEGGGGGDANAPINFQNPPLALIASEIVRYTNVERQKAGSAPLQMSAQLQKAAQMHADDMIAGNFFSHNNPVDPSRAQVTQRVAMHGASYTMIAENIGQAFGVAYQAGTSVQFGGPGVLIDPANGQPLPDQTPSTIAQSLVNSWMNSPGHRANILRSQLTHIGCGIGFYKDAGFNNIYRAKAVQVFTRP